jgi:hypothetical protein
MNGHAVSLKYSLEGDLHFFQLTIQKKVHMLQPLREKALTLISNAPNKRVALNCLHLSPPTRMGKNPTKTWKL